MIEQLIGRVFTARNVAHIEHFTTNSYARHEALGEFYEGVIPELDKLVECWQGQFGSLSAVEMPDPPEGEDFDIVDYLRDESDWIEANREEISGDSPAIGNLVDNVSSVFTRTLFKLERLA